MGCCRIYCAHAFDPSDGCRERPADARDSPEHRRQGLALRRQVPRAEFQNDQCGSQYKWTSQLCSHVSAVFHNGCSVLE